MKTMFDGKSMKILVTGGAGFIGSHIVDSYIKLGHEVHVLDDLSTGEKGNLNKNSSFHKLDILSSQAASLIQELKPDIINHHAAQINLRKSVSDPMLDASINILGLINLLEAAVKAKSVRQVIFASTGGTIYGDASKIPTDEKYDAWPVSPYGIAKLSCEHYLYYYQKAFNLPFVSLRYANVYGPRQNPHGEAGVVAIFTKKILDGESPVINGNGKQTRDFVFVEDVVKANVLATQKKTKGIYNIGTGQETNVNQIFENLKLIIGKKLKRRYGPEKIGEQKRSALDSSKAKLAFGWESSTKIEDGLQKTVSFFKNK